MSIIILIGAICVTIIAVIAFGYLLGKVMTYIIDAIISLVGAEIVGGWVFETFGKDIKVALLLIFFIALILITRKFKRGRD